MVFAEDAFVAEGQVAIVLDVVEVVVAEVVVVSEVPDAMLKRPPLISYLWIPGPELVSVAEVPCQRFGLESSVEMAALKRPCMPYIC